MRNYTSTLKIQWQQVLIGLTLVIAVAVHLLVPINPDQTLPAVPELVSVALLGSILCLTFSSGRTLQMANWSFRQSEAIALSTLWLTVLGVTGLRAILSLFYTPNQAWIPCRTVPGFATKLECLLQASITQHYGYRAFFMLLTAVTLGTLAFLIARIMLQGWKFLLGTVVFGPLLVAVVGFFCIAFGIEQALPKSLLYNAWGSQRFTQIFGNPGWVWPYFAPGLAIVFWATVAASTWASRMLWAGMSMVLILGILATQQRGGLLLSLVYITVCGLYSLRRGFKKKSLPILAVGGTVLAFLVSGLYSIFSHQQLLQELAQSIGYDWRPSALSVDMPRIEMWKAAWEIFKEAPLFGHGYASWFQLISEYGPRHNMVYVLDTSHNLFFQMLTELGLLHTLLIVSILVLLCLTAFRSSRLLPESRLLFLLAVSSFVVPTWVQEINYIRPTFYIHAIFWGTLAGLPFSGDYYHQQSPLSTLYGWLKTNFYRITNKDITSLTSPASTDSLQSSDIPEQNLVLGGSRRFLYPFFGFLTGVCLLGILFCSLNFSFGGYPFEARLSQPNTKIPRWLGQSVTLTSFATAENKSYSVYEVNPFQKPMTVYSGKAGNRLGVTVEGTDELGLALENGGRFWPRRHNLSFSTAYPDNARWISAQVFYPPVQSNLGIGWSRNMYPWEILGNRPSRWCGQDCIFLAKSCGRQNGLDFVVSAPRPDYSEAQPLSVQVSVYGLAKKTEFSSGILQNLPLPLVEVQEQFQQSGEEKPIRVKGKLETPWYLVRVQAASVFNPKAQGISQDDRNLTVVISEANCSN
ncbi:MAG TPA: O-antigen ligase family protein [Coleofasciculaceae cyanobacterium]